MRFLLPHISRTLLVTFFRVGNFVISPIYQLDIDHISKRYDRILMAKLNTLGSRALTSRQMFDKLLIVN